MIKLTDIEVRSIIDHALGEAARYADAYHEQHACEYPCGFAWVNIKPARGQFVKVMKEMKLGHTDDYEGGYSVWNPSRNSTQNMDVKEAGARAFAAELRKHGVVCAVKTRMD